VNDAVSLFDEELTILALLTNLIEIEGWLLVRHCSGAALLSTKLLHSHSRFFTLLVIPILQGNELKM
jgi:hypothetical protein